jgi:hypothetical protein
MPLTGSIRKSYLSALFVSAVFAFHSCSSSGQSQFGSNAGQQTSSPSRDAEVIEAQNAHAIKLEVTVEAPVLKVLREDDRGLPHQKFLIGLSNGTTVLIAHNLKMASQVPISAGDTVRIHGEYIWNAHGGLIHWTHHTDTPYHEGGWIEFQGVRYQ